MYFKQIYKDDPLLPDFIERCITHGYNNNSTLDKIKFDYFEHSAFFASIEDNKIKVFSGVHNFDYNGERYWRLGFRAATLYDDTFKLKPSNNFRKISLCAGVHFTLQMKWVEHYHGKSKFIMTSNDSKNSTDTAGRSHMVDVIAKRNRISGCTLLHEKINYLNTIQNVWLLDRDLWFSDYQKYYEGNIDVRLSF